MASVSRSTYLLDFSDFTGEGAVGDVDKRANLDGFGQSAV